jgi:hypothetical protein
MPEETTRVKHQRTELPVHFFDYTAAERWPHRRLWRAVRSLLHGSAKEAGKIVDPCGVLQHSGRTMKFPQRGERETDGLSAEQEILIEKSKARISELERAQRRTYLELEQWILQVQLGNEAMHAARILETAAESEARLAQSELNAVEAQVEHFSLQNISVGVLTTPSSTAIRVRLRACDERRLHACLKVQLCRRHRQLHRE